MTKQYETEDQDHSAQRDDSPPIKAKFLFDATRPMLKKKLREGQNPVMRSNSGLELVARATANEALSYSIIDQNGFPLEETISISVNETAKKKTTCWECGNDANGDTHCWKVPCPVITGPWKPGKVMELGFTFV